MGKCSASLDLSLSGLRTLILENDMIKTTILLDRGANIYQFIFKPKEVDLLFHHPRVKPSHVRIGAAAGSWWHGGIDDLLPTGYPSRYRDDDPIITELVAQEYECEIVDQRADEITAYLRAETIISPFIVEKWLTIRSGEPQLDVRTRFTNTGYADFQFLWGYHSTLAVSTDYRIDLPAGRMVTEEVANTRFKPDTEYEWPNATESSGRKIDLSVVYPPSSLLHEYHHALDLKDGWLALTNSKERYGFGTWFQKEILRSIHLWINYGYSRGCYNVGLYPMSGHSLWLHKDIEDRTCLNIDPGKSIECEVKFLAYSGLASVSKIDRNGVVT